jgi:SAM-dependent methyltransferase
LTQGQLRQAIASGGFLREPHEGQYDMLCSAATDPYTSCGFKKVICISELENFLIHHLPNKYVAELSVSLASFQEQVKMLYWIRDGFLPGRNLYDIQARFWHFWWQKSYYEKPDDELLGMIPRDAESLLSIGCGWGATEARLQESGAKVTALPLDSVIGAVAAQRGVAVIHGNWDECQTALGERKFDCVLMTDLLHLQPNPDELLEQCCKFIKPGGTLVVGGPNFGRWQWVLKHLLGAGEFKKLRSFDQCGISLCGPGTLTKTIRRAGLVQTGVRWLDHELNNGQTSRRIPARKYCAKEWLLQARRPAKV